MKGLPVICDDCIAMLEHFKTEAGGYLICTHHPNNVDSGVFVSLLCDQIQVVAPLDKNDQIEMLASLMDEMASVGVTELKPAKLM